MVVCCRFLASICTCANEEILYRRKLLSATGFTGQLQNAVDNLLLQIKMLYRSHNRLKLHIPVFKS